MAKKTRQRPDISLLIPTRGRREMLLDSVTSLIDNAAHAERLEWLFGFDEDDTDTYTWFNENVEPVLTQSRGTFSVMAFEPLGYENLHQYVNSLAEAAEGRWFVFWNDDAVMRSQNWDSTIMSHDGRFVLQAFDTHNKHPYSIFPILPREWFEVIGHLSGHQLNDAWVSQIAWMLDIVERLDVKVDHERFDLSGKNNDETYQKRRIYEGDLNDPKDFNHANFFRQRLEEAEKLANHLRTRGDDITVWEEIKAGKRDPWEKMLAFDVNKQMRRLR